MVVAGLFAALFVPLSGGQPALEDLVTRTAGDLARVTEDRVRFLLEIRCDIDVEIRILGARHQQLRRAVRPETGAHLLVVVQRVVRGREERVADDAADDAMVGD